MDTRFTYTDKIVNYLVKIEALKQPLLSMEMSTDTRYKLSLSTKIKELLYFANSLGLDFTLKDAEKITTEMMNEFLQDQRLQFVYNFKNALDFSHSNVIDTHGEISKELMLHLNKLCVEGIVDPSYAKFRDGTDKIYTKFDNWFLLRDHSIDNFSVNSLIDELIEWFLEVTPTMNALIKYLLFIYKLIEIAPFAAGNKQTILTIADLLFLRYGLSNKSFVSTNYVFLLNETKVLESFTYAQKNFNSAIWVEEILRLIIKSINQTNEDLQTHIMEEERSKKQPFLDLNKRQLKILRYLQNVPNIKREEYCHMMEVSTMTAFRDLDELVRKKLLKVEGKGRGTKYRLTSM